MKISRHNVHRTVRVRTKQVRRPDWSPVHQVEAEIAHIRAALCIGQHIVCVDVVDPDNSACTTNSPFISRASVAAIDLSEETARETVELASNTGGGRLVAVQAEVGSEDDNERAIGITAEELGGIDAVVHCAGMTLYGETASVALDDWNLVIRVNLTGAFLVIKHTLPQLIAAGGGSIVSMASIGALIAAGSYGRL